MKITLWGVRGSIPASSPETKAYGGNTSCVQIEAEDTMVLLDAGSGINNIHFDDHLSHRRIDILLTHLHIDHIQGLGFFKPLFNPDAEIHIWGPASHSQSLRARLGRYFSPPFSPVYFREFSCNLFVHEISNETIELGALKIDCGFILHPGPTLGFRVQEKEKAFTYLPDHEPALGRNGFIPDVNWISGSDLTRDADLLLHDSQFTAEEYKEKVGWGHSSMEDALAYASFLNVKRLLLSHHDPERTDRELDRLYSHLKKTTEVDFPFAMAVEGSTIVL
jgi:phosphoribosyl 1,2-cyclic phosphodiesterase